MPNNKKPKKPIIEQITTAQNDITRNYLGRILLNPDQVLSLQARAKGIEIYEDMLYEARVFSEMQKRKLAVIGKEWEVVPASDNPQDQKIADFVSEVFKKFSYDTARQAMLSGIVTGFKPGEIMWDYSEGDIWIKEIKGISPRRFAFDVENNLRLLTWANMIEGMPVPERKFLVFTNPSDNSSPYGDGLGRPLYWPIWFKKNGVKFWAVFLDKFGQPTPWGKYPPGTDKPKQDDLLDALKAMQTDQAIITPDNMSVELLEAARASSVDSYDRWEKFWNDAITFIILGQTATTEGTPGKLGEETARSDIRQEIVKADADLLCECQNTTLIPWLVDYNFPGVAEYPKVWIRTEPEKDLKGLADRDVILIRDLKLPTPLSYLYDTYGIPQPEEGEELVSLPAPQPQIPLGFAEGHGPRGVQSQTPQGKDMETRRRGEKGLPAEALAQAGQKKIDFLIPKILKDGGISEFRDSLEAIINQTTTLEDLRTRILDRFKDVDIAKMKEILSRAILIANLTGRVSV